MNFMVILMTLFASVSGFATEQQVKPQSLIEAYRCTTKTKQKISFFIDLITLHGPGTGDFAAGKIVKSSGSRVLLDETAIYSKGFNWTRAAANSIEADINLIASEYEKEPTLRTNGQMVRDNTLRGSKSTSQKTQLECSVLTRDSFILGMDPRVYGGRK